MTMAELRELIQLIVDENLRYHAQKVEELDSKLYALQDHLNLNWRPAHFEAVDAGKKD